MGDPEKKKEWVFFHCHGGYTSTPANITHTIAAKRTLTKSTKPSFANPEEQINLAQKLFI